VRGPQPRKELTHTRQKVPAESTCPDTELFLQNRIFKGAAHISQYGILDPSRVATRGKCQMIVVVMPMFLLSMLMFARYMLIVSRGAGSSHLAAKTAR
jgi:hypothetical protein